MVVAQLVERSLLTTEIRSSNPVISEIYINSCIEKTKIEKMGRELPIKKICTFHRAWLLPRMGNTGMLLAGVKVHEIYPYIC